MLTRAAPRGVAAKGPERPAATTVPAPGRKIMPIGGQLLVVPLSGRVRRELAEKTPEKP